MLGLQLLQKHVFATQHCKFTVLEQKYFVPTLSIYSVGFFRNSDTFQSVVTNRRDVISLRHRKCDQRVPFAQRLPSCSLTCACTI